MNVLEAVITGEKSSVTLPSTVTPSEIVKYMSELGYEYDLETNGWQHDFWCYFRKTGHRSYEYSGCWWDGSQSFSIDDAECMDEDDDVYDPDYPNMTNQKEEDMSDELCKRIERLYSELGFLLVLLVNYLKKLIGKNIEKSEVSGSKIMFDGVVDNIDDEVAYVRLYLCDTGEESQAEIFLNKFPSHPEKGYIFKIDSNSVITYVAKVN